MKYVGNFHYYLVFIADWKLGVNLKKGRNIFQGQINN